MLIHSLSAIRAARPHLTFHARVIVEAIHLSEGSIGAAEDVARRLGLANRFQLARLLKRDGLPSLHRLAGWTTVLSWVLTAERTGASLCRMAFRGDRYPAACYRLVVEVTGLRWGEVRALGSRWVLRRFLQEIGEAGAERIHEPVAGGDHEQLREPAGDEAAGSAGYPPAREEGQPFVMKG